MKNQEKSIILDYNELKKMIEAHRVLGHKIVCTVGSWDMLHIGHLRYLMKAKEQGDVLVVGDKVEVDLRPAWELGLKAVHICYGRGKGSTSPKVNFELKHLADLKKILRI